MVMHFLLYIDSRLQSHVDIQREMFTSMSKKHLFYGFLFAPFVMIMFVLYSVFLGRSDPTYIDSFCIEHDCECAEWYRGTAGEYQVENNVWNKGNVESFQQCVFIRESNTAIDVGWSWNWPGIRFNVVAYPNIMYGKNPWLPTSSSKLPMRIHELNCLEAEFKVMQQGSGKGNLAFDLWITNSEFAQPSNITHEIMVWLSKDGFRPAGSHVEVINIDGYEIDLWKQDNFKSPDGYKWTFLAFVYRSDFLEGSINFVEFLDYLVNHGFLTSDEYLGSVQLGNEVVSGHGTTLVQDFEIRLCDN
jgi:hypothetical protein